MLKQTEPLIEQIASWNGPSLTFMEVCGTHTMAAARFGLRSLLPKTIRLISGPGCPVCVTPVGYVDHALALGEHDGVIIATFGDLMRVPGSADPKEDRKPRTLINSRACGCDVRVVYSPLDALKIARRNTTRQVVFLGVGFETTAPTLAAAILHAKEQHLDNFSVLSAAKTIPKAMELLASSLELGLSGFLCPGHVSTILGADVYRPLAEKHNIPCAIAGFEPVEILRGIVSLLDQVSCGKARVDNCYPNVVRSLGNEKAKEIMNRVFESATSIWRGIGPIEGSGLGIRDEYAAFDAAKKFEVSLPPPLEPKGCRCGDVLKGLIDPAECSLFGGICTPDNPKGACMVSSEGSCAAWYNYQTGARQ